MKTILLAAGLGTRLKPLTNHTPKCLAPINDTPLLQIWLKILEKHKISEVLINTHHLPHKVNNFINNYSGKINIKTTHEKKLLGSAGTVKKNIDFFNNKDFLIIYADNLSNINLSKIINFHKSNKNFFTMGLFKSNNPQNCGIATLNKENLITKFIEKPKNPTSNLANAGIYICSPQIANYIPNNQKTTDFGYNVIPQLTNKMHGYIINDYLIDIGTPTNYKKAQHEWKNINN